MVLAGQFQMDSARQDWVHEHAETGDPLAAFSVQGMRETFRENLPRF
jgi:hypothetical protein